MVRAAGNGNSCHRPDTKVHVRPRGRATIHMRVDHRRLGVGVAVVGVVLLLTLRVWASPISLIITGRSGVSVVAFLLIPVLLLVVGAGVAIALWGEQLGLG